MGLMSAPPSSSSCTTVACPYCAAVINDVAPMLFFRFGSAPRLSNTRAVSTVPLEAATYSAGNQHSSSVELIRPNVPALGSPPASSSPFSVSAVPASVAARTSSFILALLLSSRSRAASRSSAAALLQLCATCIAKHFLHVLLLYYYINVGSLLLLKSV